MADDNWGEVAPSIYDTARLVRLAPWLSGHQDRIGYLCDQQSADGGWGGCEGYGVVPTLSATEALLATWRADPVGTDPRVLVAVQRGLDLLDRWLSPASTVSIPDTIAVELLIPALVDDVNAHLDALADTARAATPGFESIAPGTHLAVPTGYDSTLVRKFRAAAAAGQLPSKLCASLEVAGPHAVAAAGVRAPGGAVGASAAATAAWIGTPGRTRAAASVRFLERLQARCDGPVPGVTPITYFEHAWVPVSLATAGIPVPVPDAVLDTLEAGLGPDGAPAAPGLPADSDDTAVVLLALARHGREHRPDCLMDYRKDGYFTCFRDERTPSTSTNAHVLETLADHLRRHPIDAARFVPAVDMLVEWLLDNQRRDGSWLDKWHASAYYATAASALALAVLDRPAVSKALAGAVEWVLATQRPDGSWGRWSGTVEETSYAVQILCRAAGPHQADRVGPAIARGTEFLARTEVSANPPGLWHAKDLYAPVRVIRAARLAALAMGRQHTGDTPSAAHPIA